MSAPEGHQGPTAVGTIPSNLKGQCTRGLARQGESSETGWSKPILMELRVCYEVRKEGNWNITHTSFSLTLLSPIRGHKGRVS